MLHCYITRAYTLQKSIHTSCTPLDLDPASLSISVSRWLLGIYFYCVQILIRFLSTFVYGIVMRRRRLLGKHAAVVNGETCFIISDSHQTNIR